MIVIIDYGMGNLRSVEKKLNRVGADVMVTNQKEYIINAEKLILPGVGHFDKAVKNLKKLDIWDLIDDCVMIKKTPILGICLGMQLMGKSSAEGNSQGFGWIDAEVVKFDIYNKLKYKIPHIGWNNVIRNDNDKIFDFIDSQTSFYFVHSFHMQCLNKSDIIGETIYEKKFVSAIRKENIIGTQFHPEKSHDAGEKLIKNFLQI